MIKIKMIIILMIKLTMRMRMLIWISLWKIWLANPLSNEERDRKNFLWRLNYRKTYEKKKGGINSIRRFNYRNSLAQRIKARGIGAEEQGC
jgi:hypothetical protein